jgi:hypothetical protein
MKKLSVQKSVLCLVLVAATGAVFAQFDDSSTGPRGLKGRGVIPLKNQELQPMGSPITNNISNITQVVQPNTFQVSGTGAGQTTATAQADCGGGTLLGGGGTCSDGQGLVAVAGSSPVGNSWVIGCQSLNYKPVFATANAICSAN